MGETHIKAEYCHPAYSTYTMWNAGLHDCKAGIKIERRNTNNLRYTGDTTLMAESEEALRDLLMRVKKRDWKSWLKTQHSKHKDHSIQSHHFMANRWGNSNILFSWAAKSPWMVMAATKLKDASSLEENLWYDKSREHIKKQRHHFDNKGLYGQSYFLFQ